MFWCFAGILLWLGGWWFTGRLFPAYRKAVFYENQEHLRRDPEARLSHHAGPTLILLFDFGLLLSGLRGLTELARAISAHMGWSLLEPIEEDGLMQTVARLVPYSILILLYAVRACRMLHAFYGDQFRSLGGQRELHHIRSDRISVIWSQMKPTSRRVLMLATCIAASAPILMLFGWGPWRGNGVLAVVWLLLPASMALIALLPSIRDLRGSSLRPKPQNQETIPPEKASVS
jgi:hypothetical protein